MQKKLLFAFHLENLPENSLGNEVWRTLKELDIPGLYSEAEELMRDLGLGNMAKYTKRQWKKSVNDAVHTANHKSLLQQIKQYKKLSHEELSNEAYEVKDYIGNLPIEKSRTFMHYRAQMLKGFKMNFQSDPQFEKDNFECLCGRRDCQRHALLRCPSIKTFLRIMISIQKKVL